MGQVKTVVADDYDSPSSRRTCCSCSVPVGGGTPATQGTTTPHRRVAGGCTRRGIRLCCGASPAPLRNGHDEAVLSTDELLAELEGMEAPRQPPGPEKHAKLGRSPSSAGEPPPSGRPGTAEQPDTLPQLHGF